ncbi:Argininosuccinate lyase [Variovorax sp. PBS-H4]|uniref:Bug family tripartite tricarboxylate transporter substrate binding protein n=1 Tax=Variovorax sp. PBS-H4 TaxID=434008 RepID=UPI00131857FB|nr:tripartite tricarboxylate transporter substrate binding protein [Variovorax sp. PBS-H4]VTU37383.1 Argininosuccinate lyase [Variovorax sp. PBS-H4]
MAHPLLRRRIASALLFCVTIAASAAPPPGVWKPTRPVTLVVPYAPGGGTDTVARAVSKQLASIWNQPVIIENLPGADGLIGTRKVMDARPDGTTLLMQVPAIVLTKYTPGLKGVDPLAQLQPITAVAQASNAVVISGKLPAKSLAEFVQYCRRPGQRCSIATTDNQSRILSRQFVAEEKLDATVIVNYRGTAAIVSDMVANNVDMSFTGIAAALPHHKAGALRFVATTGDRRAAALPEVATAAESGFAQYRSVNWFGVFAPLGLTPDATQGIEVALRQAVQAPEVRAAIVAAGAEPLVNTPAEFAAQVKAEGERLGALVKCYPLE